MPQKDWAILISLAYHDIFDYPLTKQELIRWAPSHKAKTLFLKPKNKQIKSTKGYYYLGGKKNIIEKRLASEVVSKKKLEIAKRASKAMSKIPTVKFIGVTGSLAMKSADEKSDIDLMLVTSSSSLWVTRAIVLLYLFVLKIPTRRFNDKKIKNKLCLNMWLDESDLVWSKNDRNIFTAHEIAQILPLVSKGNTYETFLNKNKWIKDWWPNSVRFTKIRSHKASKRKNLVTWWLNNFIISFIERVAFKIQYAYMRSKITKEVVTTRRAIFHPVDWGETVLGKFSG